MKALKLMSCLVVLFGLTACAAKSGLTNKEKAEAYQAFIESEKLTELDRITAFRLNGWASLGDKHLILYKTHTKPYLITLNRNCYDLDFATAIKVNSNGSTLQTKFDSISVPGEIEVKCFIKSIHKVSKEQKQALFDIGKEPEEVKGTNAESAESQLI